MLVKPDAPTSLDDFFAAHANPSTPMISRELSGSQMQYAATASPPRSRPNILKRGINWIGLMYFRYEITVGPFLMSPFEKLAWNSLIVAVLFLLTWALLQFPIMLYHNFHLVSWLLDSRYGPERSNVGQPLVDRNNTPVSMFQLPFYPM